MTTPTHQTRKPARVAEAQPQVLVQRCACGGLAGQAGECAACRQKREASEGGRDRFSGRLNIAAPDGQAEAEANRTAALIVDRRDAPAPRQPIMAGVQRLPLRGLGTQTAPPLVHEAWRSAGSPLDPATRAFMEPRFGHDFSGVRVHADAEAAERAQAVQARAYTIGREIVFGAGEYAPASRQGQTLLAHELTHVVQQAAGGAALQRAPARPDSRDVNTARTRASRLAQRIKIHTKISREVRASINADLAFFDGAAKDAYVQIIRPVLRSVTEIQMPEQSMRRKLPPVRPVSMSMTADELCGGACYTDDEIYAPTRALEQREEGEREQLRVQEREKLRNLTKDWGDDQTFAADLLESVIALRANVDPRAVSDRIREPILERYRRWLRAVDAQRMAACAADKPGLLTTIRGRFNNDDPCKSWFADEYSHGPSELLDLERQLRIHRPSAEDKVPLSAADAIYYLMFDYRKKTDPGLLEQEQMAAAMVGVGVALAGGINEKVNRPSPVPKTPGSTPAPTAPEPFSVVQGGGQSTSGPKGQLSIVDTEGTIRPVTPRKDPPTTQPPASPSKGAGVQWDKPGVNDTQPPLKATGTDPVRPNSEPASQDAPKAVRRIVKPGPGQVANPPKTGTVTPAPNHVADEDAAPRGPNSFVEDSGEGDRAPNRAKGSKQSSKMYAHDVGVSEGTKAAERDGLVHVFDNPFGIDPNTPGQDTVFINPGNGHPVIVELKGGEAKLAPGQMSNAEINRQVRRLEQRLPQHPVTQLVREALDNGTLEGRTYSTRIDSTGTALPTTMEDHGSYHRLP